jgi:hypothetical protein
LRHAAQFDFISISELQSKFERIQTMLSDTKKTLSETES